MDMYSLAELAEVLGITRQSVWEAVKRGQSKGWSGSVPKPDGWTQANRPLWKRQTLERAGILNKERLRVRWG